MTRQPARLAEIAHARLCTQRLASAPLTRAQDVVRWLGAVQAQDYSSAKWALALRMCDPTSAAIDRAFAAGRILRTHVMRPTWHFVTPADIRWMLELTAPRVRAATAHYDGQLGLDARTIARSNKAIAAALRGGRQLTRQELKLALQRAGVASDGVQRLAHLTMHAELEGVICSGALRGRQFTYALLDERAPGTRRWPRDQALAELTRRYFTSHGPAQVQDFAWWSGLTTRDARTGLEMIQRDLASEVIDGRTYWWSSRTPAATSPARAAYLLPPYDEYLIAYRDRGAAFPGGGGRSNPSRDPFGGSVVIDGQVAGRWKRIVQRDTVTIAVTLPNRLTRADERRLNAEGRRLGAFLDLDVEVVRAA